MRRGAGTWSEDGLLVRGAVVACLLLLGAILPAAASGVEGQVFDDEGKALAGVTVRVVQLPPAPLLPRKDGETPPPVEIARTRTDDRGFFRLELAGWRPRGKVLLYVGDRGPWDALRYARPAPRDLTRDLRRRGGATVTVRVASAPGWPDLRAAIERAGGVASPLGRLLRRYGFPRRVVADATGRLEYDFGKVRHVVRAGASEMPRTGPRPASRRGGEAR